jgi:hypothetical protein
LFFELLDLGELAIDIWIVFQSLLELVECLLAPAKVVVAHQMNHHVKHRYNVILSAGPEKLHVVYACEQQVSLKHLDSLTSFDMRISLFFVLELVYESEIDDGNIEL